MHGSAVSSSPKRLVTPMAGSLVAPSPLLSVPAPPLVISLLWLELAVTSIVACAIVIISLPVEESTLRSGNLVTEQHCENMLSNGETPLHLPNVKDCSR